MPATVSLRKIVDHLSFTLDEYLTYLNKETGVVVTVSKEELAYAEQEADVQELPGWQREALEEASAILGSDDYIALPGQFDIHEYTIVQDFCTSIADDELRGFLLDKIHGAGAFRRFKDAIHQFGIAEDWYRFRDRALKEIAIDWLETNHVAYTDDTAQPRGERG
jgi:hypothetical protein